MCQPLSSQLCIAIIISILYLNFSRSRTGTHSECTCISTIVTMLIHESFADWPSIIIQPFAVLNDEPLHQFTSTTPVRRISGSPSYPLVQLGVALVARQRPRSYRARHLSPPNPVPEAATRERSVQKRYGTAKVHDDC